MTSACLDSASSDDEFEIIGSTAVNAAKSVVDERRATSTPAIENDGMESFNQSMLSNARALSKTGLIYHANLSSDDRDIVFKAYQSGFPEERRQVVNCNCCRHFLRKYGDLCTVGDDGQLQPLFWPQHMDKAPRVRKEYQESVLQMRKLFGNQAVGSQFFAQNNPCCMMGKPTAGGWSHLSCRLENVPLARITAQDTKTLYNMLARVLEDFDMDTIATAYHHVFSDLLPYAESHKTVIAYLRDTTKELKDRKQKYSEVRNNSTLQMNLITNYACTAWVGCISALRGGIVGTLLESVKQGDSFDELKRKWMEKADPLSYLRPTAAPTLGNLKTAEKTFEQLGYTSYDLGRVYLTADQIPKSAILWNTAGSTKTNTSSDPSSMPLFGHLVKKPVSLKITSDSAALPSKSISFRHFALQVIPTARAVDVKITSKISATFFTNGRVNSKPLMNFHSETNTAAWYVWGGDMKPERASLTAGWERAISIITFPYMWEDIAPKDALDRDKFEQCKHKRQDARYLFCLENAKDVKCDQLCLFPTLMKSEFHSVRKTVEAFSAAGRIDQPEGGKQHVGGIGIGRSSMDKHAMEVRVTDNDGLMSLYKIALFD